MNDNQAILSKYILHYELNYEHLIPLNYVQSFQDIQSSPSIIYTNQHLPRVVAVYQYTGKGPFLGDGNKTKMWEYEYMGVRVM